MQILPVLLIHFCETAKMAGKTDLAGEASSSLQEQEASGASEKRNIDESGEEVGAGAGDAKRTKVEVEGVGVAQSNAAAALLPAPPLEEAERDVEAKCGMRLTIGTRLDVHWEVGDEADENADATSVFWGCEIHALVGSNAELGPMWKLKYQPKVVEGTTFPAEERVVAFSAPHMLVDTEVDVPEDEEESRLMMQWRLEGTTPILDPLLPVGTTIRLRPSSPAPAAPAGDAPAKEEGELGVIITMYPDGTYLIALDAGGTQDRVPRKLIDIAEEEESEEVPARSLCPPRGCSSTCKPRETS